MRPRVTVVTSGHLSTCPRMLKAADALAGAGYRVRVVSTRYIPWAWATDQSVMRHRAWTWRVVDFDRSSARLLQLASGARLRGARAIARTADAAHLPFAVAARAASRVHPELVDAIAEESTDFVYGGTSGALSAVFAAAGRLRVPFGLDLEDFHSEEQTGPGSGLSHALIARIERDVLPAAAVLTASSPMIAGAYASAYGCRPTAIHNTFSMQFGTPVRQAGPLRLYWFSQTLGPGRGLDTVVRAIGRCGIQAELHLRARPIPSYAEHLSRLQEQVARSLTLVYANPAPPDDMVTLSQGYDLGLSCEEPDVLNRRICLTNKAFTYLAAGVPVVMTSTPAQAALAGDLGPAAFLFEPGNVDALSELLRRLAADAETVRCARHAARAAAERRWHWEHPDDRGALLMAVEAVVG